MSETVGLPAIGIHKQKGGLGISGDKYYYDYNLTIKKSEKLCKECSSENMFVHFIKMTKLTCEQTSENIENSDEIENHDIGRRITASLKRECYQDIPICYNCGNANAPNQIHKNIGFFA